MARSYTLAEIDQMRKMVEDELYDGHGGYNYGGGSSDHTTNLILAQQNQIYAARVEDRLRTYMLAGLGPADLLRSVENRLTPDSTA